MKKKILWLLVSGLMVLSLVMAACAPAAVEEKEEEKAPVTEEKAPEQKVEEEVVAPTGEPPKYGGILRLPYNQDIVDFDDIVTNPWRSGPLSTTETLWAGDWTKGNAGGYGTKECEWTQQYFDIWEDKAGYIAESWEIPTKIEGEIATIIYHIRKGVHFGLNPASEASRLVGGRELTADDVVFNLKQTITDPRGQIYRGDPGLREAKITSPAPWTVKVEIPWEFFEITVSRFGEGVHMVPPEVVAKYGDMSNWRVNVGTGPFMLTDVVSGTSATLVRNPNYWMKDPIGPGKGNQLPYLDGVKFLIIPDYSTLYAAIRTAKVDFIGGHGYHVPWEDAAMLKEMTPQLMLHKIVLLNPGSGIVMRVDTPPFNDIRVRRALMMAIDFEAIKNDLYAGDAQIITFPICYAEAYAAAFLGLDDPECPESVKELYTYNPQKARALLAEAGYPKGFKTNIVIESPVKEIDYHSVIADMWSKVGVDLELKPLETGAYTTIKNSRTQDQLIASSTTNTALLFKCRYYYGTGMRNLGNINDPVVNEAFAAMQRAVVTSRAEAMRIHKELMKHVLDQAWVIPRVSPYTYDLWWPWLKNFNGEDMVGYIHGNAYNWIWYDQELKKSMGY